jgi:DNA/RNA-binding domain of Phe-tRNA-synthetase-like protein
MNYIVSETFKATYPGAAAGVLAMSGVKNPASHPALDAEKAELEQQLRARFGSSDRAALLALPALQAYAAYYKRFKKTFHVQLQLESVAFKDKPIPRAAALVEAMFMAELKNLLLTAGHDAASIRGPVTLNVASGNERYITISGQEQTLKPGDMFMSDEIGILSAILYGPDQRTRITPETMEALFTVYAPAGIEETAIYDHLRDIQANALLVAPEAKTTLLQVYHA